MIFASLVKFEKSSRHLKNRHHYKESLHGTKWQAYGALLTPKTWALPAIDYLCVERQNHRASNGRVQALKQSTTHAIHSIGHGMAREAQPV
jgi:hypothetical protein